MNESKLSKILKRCKCGVHLIINEHRDGYDTAEERLEQMDDMNMTENIPGDVRSEMIKRDIIIDLQFYPDTPIGSYSVYHYDLDSALDEALRCLRLNMVVGHVKI